MQDYYPKATHFWQLPTAEYESYSPAGPRPSAYLASPEYRRYNRLGYILTHAAIIVFCAADLYNADIPVKLDMLTGAVRSENNFHIPLSEVTKKAWLSDNNPAYRGTVTVPEGQSTQVVYELVGNGYLVQPLPFRIMLKRFHVAYYSTGMPKDFISKIVLYNNEGTVLKEANVRVNHPLTYHGVQIFQASFVDGGSLLKMKRYMFSGRLLIYL